MVLKVKKATFDSYGNVSMLLHHKGFNIHICSSHCNEDLEEALLDYGDFVHAQARHPGYSKSGSFKDRVYTIRDYIPFSRYKYFIRYLYVTDKTIQDILSSKVYLYNINVIISKYGVGLCSLSSMDDEADCIFSRVATTDTKTALVSLINAVVNSAYRLANIREVAIFAPRDDDYNDIYF